MHRILKTDLVLMTPCLTICLDKSPAKHWHVLRHWVCLLFFHQTRVIPHRAFRAVLSALMHICKHILFHRHILQLSLFLHDLPCMLSPNAFMYMKVLNQCFSMIMIYGVYYFFQALMTTGRWNRINKFLACVETEGICLLISMVLRCFIFQ